MECEKQTVQTANKWVILELRAKKTCHDSGQRGILYFGESISKNVYFQETKGA